MEIQKNYTVERLVDLLTYLKCSPIELLIAEFQHTISRLPPKSTKSQSPGEEARKLDSQGSEGDSVQLRKLASASSFLIT